MNIAIIPARGGSKRIPRKNIRSFAGKPMIAHAIKAVIDSGLFERVVVSTDDAEVASIANAWGAEVPFIRPTDLADDHTPTVPVVADAINRCEALGWQGEYICCVYPCAPFIAADDLQGALAALRSSDLDYCFAVAEYSTAVQRALRRAPDGTMSPMYPEHELTRTQDLDKAFRDAGQFYWGCRTAWLTNPRLHGSSMGFVIPGWRAIDIDTEDDWRRAELQYQLVSPLRGAAGREGESDALS
jgi:N-acylneuraminate cytidylyltransferase